jgi:hypothetical protein
MEFYCFSDESRFHLGGHDGYRRVRCIRGERQNVEFVLEPHRAITGGIMMWGVVCYSPETVVRPYPQILGNVIFHHFSYSSPNFTIFTNACHRDS